MNNQQHCLGNVFVGLWKEIVLRSQHGQYLHKVGYAFGNQSKMQIQMSKWMLDKLMSEDVLAETDRLVEIHLLQTLAANTCSECLERIGHLTRELPLNKTFPADICMARDDLIIEILDQLTKSDLSLLTLE